MPEVLLPFLLTSLVVELTPGPNMAYLTVLSLGRGRAAGLAAVAGVALGLLVLGLLTGFGLGSLIFETRWLYELLRWAGVAYLIWLAWNTWVESQAPVADSVVGAPLATFFRRGLTTNLLNPKAALFYIAVLPNFVSAERSVGLQSLALTLAYVAVATAVHAAVVLAASLFQPLFASPPLRRGAGLASAIALLAIAAWLGFVTHRLWPG